MRLMTLGVVGLSICTWGCAGRVQPMACESVLGLRAGQSRAEVKALLGEPHFEVEQITGWGDGQPEWETAEDYIFFYGTTHACDESSALSAARQQFLQAGESKCKRSVSRPVRR